MLGIFILYSTFKNTNLEGQDILKSVYCTNNPADMCCRRDLNAYRRLLGIDQWFSDQSDNIFNLEVLLLKVFDTHA